MKKLLILMTVLILPNMAQAIDQTACVSYWKESQCGSYTYTMYGSTENSTSATTKCFDEYMDGIGGGYIMSRRAKVVTNVTCASGYTKTHAGITNKQCDYDNHNTTINLSYYKCGCSNTVTWSGWTTFSINPAYQRNTGTGKNCSTGETQTVYKYRCNAGYFSVSGVAEAEKQLEITCEPCPANAASCAAGSTTFTCNAGYYRYDTQCVSCVDTCGVGHTSAAGATSYLQCRAEASVTLDDGLGQFQYTTACCCAMTCDETCESGQSCKTADDCPYANACIGGCCKAATPCVTGTQCTSNSDCTGFQTCIDGCCGFDLGGQICAPGVTGYCASADDCGLGEICNRSTNCCEEETLIAPISCKKNDSNYCTQFVSCKLLGQTCNLLTNCCEDAKADDIIK